MMNAMMNRLPTELSDYIIDFHHSDKRTLKVCSLVCRKWLPASRFHLFGRVVVFHNTVHSFVKLLASPSSTIASHVHTLWSYTTSINVPVFDVIAPHFNDLVALKSFTLEGEKWDPISETSLSRAFGRIGSMKLTRVLHDYHFGRSTLTFTLGHHNPSSLSTTLRVLHTAMDGNQPSSWLPVVAQLPTVGQLGFFFIPGCRLQTVRAVLKSGGQSIHTIKLGFSFQRLSLALISDYIDLTHNTNLRSLAISRLALRDSEQTTGVGSVLKIIQRISSTSVAHIEIGVQVDNCEGLAQLDCEKLADELCNRSRFPELQKVCIVVRGLSGKDEAAALVHITMSGLADRGILDVKFFK